MKKWSEGRAAALKDQCLVDDRVEFPIVLRKACFRPQMTDWPEEQT